MKARLSRPVVACAALALACPAGAAADDLPVFEIDGRPKLRTLELVAKTMGVSKKVAVDRKLGTLGFVGNNLGQLPIKDLGAGPAGEDGLPTRLTAFDAAKLAKIKAPDADLVKKLHKFLKRLDLLPDGAKLQQGMNSLSIGDATGKIVGTYKTERAMWYDLKLGGLPLEGPGAKISAAVDHTGDISSLIYTLPEFKKVGALPKLAPEAADVAARILAAPCTADKPQVLTLDRKLGYYAFGAAEFPKAERIYPQYQYTPTINRGDEKVTLKTFTLPAVKTGFQAAVTATFDAGKVIADAKVTGGRAPYRYRWSSCTASAGNTDAAHLEYPYLPRRPQADAVTEELLLTVYDADGVKTVAKAKVEIAAPAEAEPTPAGRSLARTSSVSTVDAGAEYIAGSEGIPNSGKNAEGFYTGMKNRGISTPVWYGEGDFWETDLEDKALNIAGANDVTYGDNVDMLYVSTHGNANGLSTYDGTGSGDGFAARGEMSLGENDLEWFIHSACQTLSGNDVITRWAPTFNSLHGIFGYYTTAADVSNEGATFATYLNGYANMAPKTVRDAWFTATAATEPAGKVMAAMGVLGPNGITSVNDYFWNKGSVSPDVPKSQIAGWWLYYRAT